MATVDGAIQRIREFAQREQLTKGRLAVRAGLTDSVLHRFDRDDWNPTRATLQRLEAIIPDEIVDPRTAALAQICRSFPAAEFGSEYHHDGRGYLEIYRYGVNPATAPDKVCGGTEAELLQALGEYAGSVGLILGRAA